MLCSTLGCHGVAPWPSRVDPATGKIVARIPIDGSPREITVGAGGVWVTADAQ